MNPWRTLPMLPLALVITGREPVASAQDFDPHGRHHTPTPHGNPPGRHPAPHAAEPTSPAQLIERYTRIVLSQPGAPFPLQRLAQLYRERDGSLNALSADLQRIAAASGPDPYAATVTLAGVAKLDGRPDDAIRIYAQAIEQRPTDATAILALAHLLQDRGDLAASRARYEQALPLQTAPADRNQTLRALMTLALDAKDWDGAKRFHGDLVAHEPNSLFVKGELGRELYARGEYARAVDELKLVVRAASGDNRALAPALKDLGQAQAKAHENADALVTLERGLAAAGSAAAVRAEIYQIITEVYRADQALPLLIKKLEDQHPGDYARLALLGTLYEEMGDAANALRSYRRALAVEPRQIDLRLKMIRLLQANGELEQAIAAYEGIIRAAPSNPQFVFELCDALIQRGDRARALRLLTELQARASTDEEVQSRLGEFYGRIGESERATKVLARLAEIGGNDPSHLADLGDHYFQDGNTALAVATWKRILVTVTPRARALAALGDIFVEHDMMPEALVELREAVELEPQNLAFQKDLATALERAKAYHEAVELWETLAKKAKAQSDRVLAREARTHVVTLWTLEHSVERHVGPLRAAFENEPPDLEAGRTLAEVLIHQRRLPDAEAMLRRVVELAPGDTDTYLALERALVQQGKIDDAITVLSRLVQVDPKRAREIYQRMAQYALQIYKDAEAIKYAARAVELNPDDAEGHRRLADMYRSRQDPEHAILEYRAAIAKNDRLFLVYFELADMLLSKGETDEADRLFRRVLRGAPDEELVARAARLSMQINLGKGTLGSLEQDLLPLAIGNPQKPIYRRLLVEMYGNLTFGLVQKVRHAAGKDGEDARAALARVGQRAVKPLLDALADGDGGQQRIAVDVLGYVANKNAGPALFGFATGTGETSLRLRAMIACGALRDPSLLGRYSELLLPQVEGGGGITPSDVVAVAAAWGVARMDSPRALPLLRKLMRVGSSDIRALAVLGLGRLKDTASVHEVVALAQAIDAGNVARAAAAYTLGELGADASAPQLVTLAEEGDALPRQMALLSLARMGRGRPEPPGGRLVLAAMADAVFAGGDQETSRTRLASESLRRAGVAALVMMADPGGSTTPSAPSAEIFPAPDGAVQVESILLGLVPTMVPEKATAKALVAYASEIERAARTALETSTERARAVLSSFLGGNGALEPFVGPEETPATAAAHVKARAILRALEPGIVVLARHPEARLRMQAISLLAGSTSPAATEVIVEATNDSSEAVQRVALASLGAHRDPRALSAAFRVLSSHPSWSLRILAAEALGKLGLGGAGAEAARDLSGVATTDSFALVREACLIALASFDAGAAEDLARRLEHTDPEARVRETARLLAHDRVP